MVQKIFGIYNDELADCDLFIETGNDYIACWCKNKETKIVQAFELFSFIESEATDFANLFKQVSLYSRLFTTNFDKAFCIWGHEQSTCIPALFDTEVLTASFMELMFAQNGAEQYCKNTTGDIVTLAVLPSAALTEYRSHFTVSGNVHKYYQLLKGQQSLTPANKLHVVFYSTHFIVSAYKEGLLQIIQTYPYKAPEDVLYQILNICNNCEMAVNETMIYASGLVDTASPLYQTLRSYLDHFSFEPVDKALYAAEGFHEHPLHYFASFCQYDL